MTHYDNGLKDPSVWKNGCDVSEEELREHAVNPDAANEAIRLYNSNAHVSPLGKSSFRASLIFLYQNAYHKAKSDANSLNLPQGGV